MPAKGSAIAITGFPGGSNIAITNKGHFKGRVSGRDGQPLVSIDYLADNGDSGVPIYVANGDVIGLLLARGDNASFGRTTDGIQHVLTLQKIMVH